MRIYLHSLVHTYVRKPKNMHACIHIYIPVVSNDCKDILGIIIQRKYGITFTTTRSSFPRGESIRFSRFTNNQTNTIALTWARHTFHKLIMRNSPADSAYTRNLSSGRQYMYVSLLAIAALALKHSYTYNT